MNGLTVTMKELLHEVSTTTQQTLQKIFDVYAYTADECVKAAEELEKFATEDEYDYISLQAREFGRLLAMGLRKRSENIEPNLQRST